MAITTSSTPEAWSPSITYFPPEEAVPDSLVLTTSTVAGSIEGDAPSVLVPWVDDAEAGFVTEGDAIPEAQPTLSEAAVFTGKVSQLLRLSREQFAQQGAAQLLSNSVARAVTKAANAAFIAQPAPSAPAGDPPAGLINTEGILTGGEVGTDLDELADLFASIEANGGTVTNLIAAPDAWAALRKIKVGTGSAQSLLGAGTTDAQRTLLDVPVVTSAAVPAGTLIAVDKTAIVSAVGQVQIQQSEHVYFASDSIGLRCTWRFGATVTRPERIGTLTIAAGA